MLNQDYIFVQLLSSPEVAATYKAIYSGENSREARLGNSTKVEVEILSVVLGDSNGVETATIRANLKTMNKNSREESVSTKVITLSYEYQLSRADEKNHLENPLGFKVINY